MKRLIKLLTVTAGAALLAHTSSATVILNTSYTSSETPPYANGTLNQNGWMIQPGNVTVANVATSGDIYTIGGWIRTGYPAGLRGSTVGNPTAVGGFAFGDRIKITYDLQLQISTNLTSGIEYFQVGVASNLLSQVYPQMGFRVYWYNTGGNATAGQARFVPALTDAGNSIYTLNVNGTDLGIDYANVLAGGTNYVSSPIRVFYTLKSVGSGANWEVESLLVSNMTSSATWTYAGALRSFTLPTTSLDFFFDQAMTLFGANGAARATSGGVKMEYLPAPNPDVWNGDVSTAWDTSTANWKTNGVAGASYTDGDPVSFDDTANGAGAVSVVLDTTVNPLSVTINNTNRAYALSTTGSGVIAGPAPLSKKGPGTASVGMANTYSGATTISAGKLVGITAVGSAANSAFTVASGATNGVSVSAADTTFAIKSLTMSAGTTYLDFDFGAFTPSTAVAPLDANNGASASFIVNPGAKISIRNGTGWTVGTTYPLVKYTGAAPSLGNIAVISLPSGVSGQLVIDVPNSWVALSVTLPEKSWNGNLSTLWDIGGAANWKSGGSPGFTYNDGDTVGFDDSCTPATPVSVLLNTTVSPYVMQSKNTNKNYTISGSGSIAGAAALVKTGSGVLTLSTINSYSGGTDIRAGILKVGANDALPTGTVIVQTGGSLDLNGNNQTISALNMDNGNIVGSGTLTLFGAPTWNNNNSISGGTLDISSMSPLVGSSGLTTLGSTLSGVGALLTRSGNGTAGEFAITNNNTYDGGTLFGWNAPYTRIGNDGALGTGPITFTKQARLSSTDSTAHVLTNPVTMLLAEGWEGITLGHATRNGKLTLAGPVTLASRSVFLAASSVEISGTIDDAAGNFDFGCAGSAELIISGTNTCVGGTVVWWGGGPLRLANDNGLGAGLLTIHNQGKLSTSGSATRTITQSADFADGEGAVFLGGTAPNNGTLVFNGPVTLHGDTPTDGIMGVALTAYSDVVINGAIGEFATPAAPRNLRKLGAGTLSLNGVNTYTGTNAVQAGTLLINGSVANGVTVVAGTLGGTGTINGDVLVNTTGTLAPGASIGTLTATGPITLAAGSTAAIEVNKGASTKDLATSGGAVTYAGTLAVTNLSGTLVSGDSFKVFHGTSYAGQFTLLTAAIPGAGLAWDASSLPVDGNLKVSTVVVPAVTSLTNSPSGATLNITGGNGQPYTILSSTNLSSPTWTVMQKGIFGPAPLVFNDPAAATAPTKFYRISVP